VRVTCSENRGRTRGPSPACGCGGDDAARSGAGEGNGDEFHCVVGFNPHKHGVLAILLGFTDGFTHIRGPLLTLRGAVKPLGRDSQPNLAYFQALDDRLLAASTRGFTLDLLLADESFLGSGTLNDWQQSDLLIRYLVARYGGLNVTWQGIERFEDVPSGRALLKGLNGLLQKYDGFQHPRSTDARASSSPLLADGWMNYLIEAVPTPDFGAVEHQFTQQPEIHVVHATAGVDPDDAVIAGCLVCRDGAVVNPAVLERLK